MLDDAQFVTQVSVGNANRNATITFAALPHFESSRRTVLPMVLAIVVSLATVFILAGALWRCSGPWLVLVW